MAMATKKEKKAKASYDSKWEEVVYINSYALFMAYLSMAVRGMGVLVLTWSTVVLLGGFVSTLQRKDFWCLTIITLVQTAGVFDVSLNDKLKYIRKSYFGFVRAVHATVASKNGDNKLRLLVAAVIAFVQQLVFAVILCPLAALYLCGLVITGGISLWRLIRRDYSGVDGGPNLEPALNVLYSLALFQGVLFCYRFFSYSAGHGLISKVVAEYKLGESTWKSVQEYLRQTRNGCAKDPSFVKERNLVTYAVGLIKSESSVSYLSGARILDGLLANPNLKDQHSMIAQLIGSASCSHIVEKLLQALDSRSQQDKEIMELAARIVVELAGEIHLNRFPQGILCISSLLETSQRQPDDDSAPPAEFKVLMVQGLAIIDRLAADKQNCRAICEAPGLLFKVMAPISSDMLHLIDHVEWSDIAAASLQVMCRIVTSPGRTGNNLRSKIWNNTEVINSLMRILECEKCDDKLYILAIKILTRLPMKSAQNAAGKSAPNEAGKSDPNEAGKSAQNSHKIPVTTNEISSKILTERQEKFITERQGKFIKTLASIFTSETKDSSIRKLAGEALAMLSERCAAIFLKENGGVVNDLSELLVNASDSIYRIRAAEILKHLCMNYTDNDDYFKKLMEAMKDVTPKVLIEILPCGSTKKEVQTGNETDKDKYQAPGADLEDGHDACGVSQDTCLDKIIFSLEQKDEQPVDRKLHAGLLSLCAAIFDKLISDEGHDLAPLVHAIVSKDAAFSFVGKLKEMVRINEKPTANCLMIMKIISNMVISMMQHGGWYVKGHLDNFDSLMLSLSSASNNMLALEGFMIFASSDRRAMKDFGTLASLVNEAQKLLEINKKEHQVEIISAASRVDGSQLIE